LGCPENAVWRFSEFTTPTWRRPTWPRMATTDMDRTPQRHPLSRTFSARRDGTTDRSIQNQTSVM